MATVDTLDIQIKASADKAVSSLDRLIAKLKQMQSTLSSTASSSITRNFTATVNANINNTARAVGNVSKSSNSANKAFKGLASSFGKFYASCFLVIRAVKQLGNAIQSSMDYVETYNYFSVTMSKLGVDMSNRMGEIGKENAEVYAKNFADTLNELTRKMTGYSVGSNGELNLTDSVGLGLDANQIMQFQAKVTAVTNAVGLLGETSVDTAKGVSMLAADLSSLTNTDLSQVMTNLSSGLMGQSRALYKYGIDITQATLAQYALTYGVTKSVAEMTQAEKMQLRLLAILDQSKVAWGDQANTINSVANQYRVFQQQLGNLSRIIGNLFLPIVQKALPIINGMVVALQRLFTSLGFSIWGDSWLKELQDGISGGVADDLEDMADEAEDANDKVEKLKDNLQGFDEINKLSDSTDSLSGLGDTLDLSWAIKGALSEYERVWNEALANSENKINQYADIFERAFEPFFKPFKQLFNGEFAEAGLSITELATNLLDWVDKGLKLVDWGKVGLNLGEFIGGVSIDQLWVKVGEVQYDLGEAAIKLVGGLTTGGINSISATDSYKFEGFSDLFNVENWKKFKADPKKIGSLVTTVLSNAISPIVGPMFVGLLNKFFGSDISEMKDKISNKVQDFSKAFTEKWGEIQKPLLVAWDWAKGVFDTALTNLKEDWKALKPTVDVAIEITQEIVDTAKETVIKLWKSPVVQIALGLVNKAIEKLKETVTEKWGENFSVAVALEVVKNGISKLWNGIVGFWGATHRTLVVGLTWISETAKKLWDSLYSKWQIVRGVLEVGIIWIGGVVKTLWENLCKLWDDISKDGLKVTIKGLLGISSSGGAGRAFATGGFPDEDGIFYANHNELVGKFSNGKTAVVNNAQIIEGVSAGVYDAVVSAMSNVGGGTTNVYVGGRQLTDVVIEDVNRRTISTGVNPILI